MGMRLTLGLQGIARLEVWRDSEGGQRSGIQNTKPVSEGHQE